MGDTSCWRRSEGEVQSSRCCQCADNLVSASIILADLTGNYWSEAAGPFLRKPAAHSAEDDQIIIFSIRGRILRHLFFLHKNDGLIYLSWYWWPESQGSPPAKVEIFDLPIPLDADVKLSLSVRYHSGWTVRSKGSYLTYLVREAERDSNPVQIPFPNTHCQGITVTPLLLQFIKRHESCLLCGIFLLHGHHLIHCSDIWDFRRAWSTCIAGSSCRGRTTVFPALHHCASWRTQLSMVHYRMLREGCR